VVVCTCALVCVHGRVRMCVYLCAYMYSYMHTITYLHLCVCMHGRVCMCVYLYVHTNTYPALMCVRACVYMCVHVCRAPPSAYVCVCAGVRNSFNPDT